MHKLQSLSKELLTLPRSDVERLIDALSAPPASFVWSAGENVRSHLIGIAEGIVLQVLPDKIECAAVMAYDAPVLAQNNATLMLLCLAALRSAWSDAGAWLAREMQQAKQSPFSTYAGPNGEQACCFEYDKRRSRAILTIKRR